MHNEKIRLAAEKGITKWLRNYLIEALPDLDQPSTDYQAWFDELIEAFIANNLVTPKQQKNYLTSVRNAIKVLDSNHPALDIIKFSKETWTRINEADRDRIAECSTKLIDNPDKIVEKAIELVQTNNWSDIAAGLTVLTRVIASKYQVKICQN